MALITRSIEMSFSLSRLRRTLRSMSTRLPYVVAAEFHLNLPRSEFGEAEPALLTFDIENHTVAVRRPAAARHDPRRAPPAVSPPPAAGAGLAVAGPRAAPVATGVAVGAQRRRFVTGASAHHDLLAQRPQACCPAWA